MQIKAIEKERRTEAHAHPLGQLGPCNDVIIGDGLPAVTGSLPEPELSWPRASGLLRSLDLTSGTCEIMNTQPTDKGGTW
jgi:hypothetical protein